MKLIRILTVNNLTVYPVLNRNTFGIYYFNKLAKCNTAKQRAKIGDVFINLRNITLD